MRLQPKGKKNGHAFYNFNCKKVIVLDLCGDLKIWNILSGLIQAFGLGRCQSLSWSWLPILWAPWLQVSHLRRKPMCTPHWSLQMPCLNQEVIELKANPFLKSLQKKGIFINVSSLPAWKNAAALCALPMKAARGALLSDSAFQGLVRVCKQHHLCRPYSSFKFHRWHGGIV